MLPSLLIFNRTGTSLPQAAVLIPYYKVKFSVRNRIPHTVECTEIAELYPASPLNFTQRTGEHNIYIITSSLAIVFKHPLNHLTLVHSSHAHNVSIPR